MKALEQLFEAIIWNTRLAVILPVVIGLIIALGLFVTTTVDALYLMGQMADYMNPDLPSEEREDLQKENITDTVAVVDGYLLAAIMLIFSMGLYELFVNKIDLAETSEFGERVLLIKSLDDLKERLANVILLILIVKFFQKALGQHYDTPESILFLSVGIILVAGALYLSARSHKTHG